MNLRAKGVLSDAQADAFAPVARGERLSIRGELRLLLYGGVLLLAGGIGLFLKENHERLGPALIAALAGAAALGCLAYVVRRSPPFSWGPVASPHIAVDYLLLLAVLVFAADLAYVETQFRLLGPNWPYHLLLVAIAGFAAAYRFDSRAVLTLALTSFAAWRGVSVGMPFADGGAATGSPGAVRGNAIVCGLLYVAAGIVSVRKRRKAHFEPVWVTGGLVLVFGALLSGAWGHGSEPWPLWEAALFLLAAAVMAIAYRLRRPLDFAIALAAVYLGGLRALEGLISGPGDMLIVAAWSIGALVVLIAATRRLRRTE